MDAIVGLAFLAAGMVVLATARAKFARSNSLSTGEILASMLTGVLSTVLITFGLASLIRLVFADYSGITALHVTASLVIAIVVIIAGRYLLNRFSPPHEPV